ncbi:MAG: substrate-binding domain-containing protein [Planctomycetota bacterium]
MGIHSYPYLQLADELKRELALSNYSIGDAFKTAHHLMDKHKVAYLTARKAIDVLIEEGYLERPAGCKPRILRIPAISQEMIAKKVSDFTVAVIAGCTVTDTSENYESVTYRHTLGALEARSINHFTSHVMHSSQVSEMIDKLTNAGLVNGLIISCQYKESIAQHLEHSKIPAVLIDYAPKTAIVDSVNINNQFATQLAIRRLLQEERKRIDFVGHQRGRVIDDDARELRDAWADLREPLGFNGIPYLVDNRSNNMTAEQIARRIIESDPRPTGLFVSNPNIALKIKNELESSGVSIPNDISIICIGGDFISDFPITHIAQKWDLIAETAVERLVMRMTAPDSPAMRINCVGSLNEGKTTLERVSSSRPDENGVSLSYK